MRSKLFLLFFLTFVLHAQQDRLYAPPRHSTGIGFTLISTNLERGGGGFGAEYFYMITEEFRLGAKALYGFYGYEYRGKQNVQSNSLSLMPALRFFVLEDLYIDFDAGMYREGSDIMRERSNALNNHLAHSIGAGYAINYSPKISALIGVRSFTVRGKDLDGIVEHQFIVNVGVAIRMLRKN